MFLLFRVKKRKHSNIDECSDSDDYYYSYEDSSEDEATAVEEEKGLPSFKY
jgi:hypothetical protein